MFKWKKMGLIFEPNARYFWMNSHAQVPYSVVFDDFIRVYFSTREKEDSDGMFKSHSGYVDLDIKDLRNIINVSSSPIINLGGIGEFDEFGSMAGSIVKHDGKFYLYYCGWQRCVSVPYNWSIGLGISDDGSYFKKLGNGPILGSSLYEPYLQACPIVYKTNENEWHMFYLSGVKWINLPNGKKESQYLLHHAYSNDGINWIRDNKPIIEPLVENECQTSASIIKIDDIYHMFFSYRHGVNFRDESTRNYRIGYAYSYNFLDWIRDDSKAGIDISESGWDSKMVAYPHLQNINGQTVMFYCGNGFGKSGFGYAILEQ
jgi:predicted GH43/DUF377 family glycosyl hydrolase